YRDYDLDRGYKVVINSRDAYRNFNRDRVRYAKYIGVRNQRIIRYSKSPRYQEVKAHPHGLAPGRAKKTYYAERNDNHDHRRSNEHGNSRSHGRGKH
ncbi:MAG TPA: hypothetical protein VFM79_11400, partial [Pelobium sp.]|nr:hypothetical protein [Pelobium sp.]